MKSQYTNNKNKCRLNTPEFKEDYSGEPQNAQTHFSVQNNVFNLNKAEYALFLRLILKYFFLPIAIAIIVSLPVAYYIAYEWLKDFTYRINLSVGLIAFSISIILIVTFLSIVRQTIKAAITNPAESLRLE